MQSTPRTIVLLQNQDLRRAHVHQVDSNHVNHVGNPKDKLDVRFTHLQAPMFWCLFRQTIKHLTLLPLHTVSSNLLVELQRLWKNSLSFHLWGVVINLSTNRGVLLGAYHITNSEGSMKHSETNILIPRPAGWVKISSASPGLRNYCRFRNFCRLSQKLPLQVFGGILAGSAAILSFFALFWYSHTLENIGRYVACQSPNMRWKQPK